MNRFEYFLAQKHAKVYRGTDDDMPDAFEHWLSEQDGNQIIDYAEEALQLDENKIDKIKQTVLEDVPHQFQTRLLQILN